jgi:short-subunit dehydrogenase
LVNNAGIARLNAGALEPALIDTALSRQTFYGVLRTTQAFAPVISTNGGGAVINVLSDATWFARPILAAYSTTNSAAWSFINALRSHLREKGIQMLALHVGFMETDMTKNHAMKKVILGRSPLARSTRLRRLAKRCSRMSKRMRVSAACRRRNRTI